MFAWLQGKSEAVIDAAAAELSKATLAQRVVEIRYLIGKHPILLDRLDSKGEAPLHIAVMAMRYESVECLVDLGADVHLKDALGWAPEQWVLCYGEGPMGYYSKTCRRVLAKLRAASVAPK